MRNKDELIVDGTPLDAIVGGYKYRVVRAEAINVSDRKVEYI